MNLCMGMAHSKPQQETSAATDGTTNGAAATTTKRKGLVSRLRKKFNLYHRDKSAATAPAPQPTPPAIAPTAEPTTTAETAQPADAATTTAAAGNPKRGGRRDVVPGLPRKPTLQRIQSEKRERLKPYEPPNHERRARTGPPATNKSGRTSSRSLQPIQSQSIASLGEQNEEEGTRRKSEPIRSMLDVEDDDDDDEELVLVDKEKESKKEVQPEEAKALELDSKVKAEDTTPALPGGGESAVSPKIAPLSDPRESEPQIISASEEGLSDTDSDSWAPKEDKESPLVSKEVEEEMEWRWILNLSMHFRDESNREKFFVTYAQERNIRRRLTISCDYRNAEEGTLEKDLSSLRFQRDKSAKIYESIRESLQDIMFYDTITNLKLQTSEGRLHVHVTEDVNEIIPYPPMNAIAHLRCPKYRESELEFDSHLSGFVYKVGVGGDIMIKKEIPGPDTVDEFLYEINALYALADSDNVIQFGGCVVDDARQKVKGLLISFASQGALIDILFHQRGKLPWARREKWAKQIVSGLSEIHEAGYVQGDFTLSNIVIDEHDNAKIIDINRRGCPVGWEPPEITAMIEGLQRIGMYIGVKSDVFQLGMVLWGMAHEMDEPESMSRPLTMDQAPEDIPTYFREIVEACLCDKPQGRPSAKDIIGLFPERIDEAPHIVESSRRDGRPLPGITSWNQANGYFPEVAGSEKSKQRTVLNGEALESLNSASHHGANPVFLPSLNHQGSGYVVAPPFDDEPLSPGTQVIIAAPSESDFSSIGDGERMPNPVVYSVSSLGGVELERGDSGGGSGGSGGIEIRSSRASGVIIPPEEYLALLCDERERLSSGATSVPLEPVSEHDRNEAGTPRPATARKDNFADESGKRMENGNGNGNGHHTNGNGNGHSGNGHSRNEWEESPPLRAGAATPATEILSFEDAKESFTPTEELDFDVAAGYGVRVASTPV